MTPDDSIDPALPDDEREELQRLASYLEAQRPVPAPAFRGRLRRLLVDGDRERSTPFSRTAALRFGVLSTVCGLVLLLVAALGVASIGPLAPQDVGDAVAALIGAGG